MNLEKWNLLARAVDAKLQGKRVQLVGPVGNLWEFTDPNSFGMGASVESIRIIEPEEFIPWTQNQVPFTAKYRLKTSPDNHFVMQETTPHKVVFGPWQGTYKELLEHFEYTIPGNVGNWLPCGIKTGGKS